MADRDLLNTPEYRGLHPAARLALLILRTLLPRRGWGRVPGTAGALSELSGMPLSRCQAALAELEEQGLVVLDGDTVYLSPLAARTPPMPRGERADKRASKSGAKPAKAPREPRRGAPTRRAYTPEFETAWSIYPKRSGGNPKVGAFKAWRARLAEGVSAEELTEAARKYADYCEAAGKTGTELVMQAQTFWGPNERWKDDYDVSQPDVRPGGGLDPYNPYGG